MEHSLKNVTPKSIIEKNEDISGEQLRGYWRLHETESNKQDNRATGSLTEATREDTAVEHPPGITFNLELGNPMHALD